MEPEQIIPTFTKSKIPHTLSYPVTAKTVSQALADVPQFRNLKLHFWLNSWELRKHRFRGAYPVIQVEFLHTRFPVYKSALAEREWTVTVSAVPRALRHVLHLKIVAEALPAMRAWLISNPPSEGRDGRHGLYFTYYEAADELKASEKSMVEWSTVRSG